MSQAQKIPFLNLFSAWRPGEELAALAGGYLVTGAVIDKAARSIRAKVECPRMPEEGLRHQIEKSLALAYRVERVELEMGAAAATAPTSAPVAAEPAPAASAPPPPPPAPGGGGCHGGLPPHGGDPPESSGWSQNCQPAGEKGGLRRREESCSTANTKSSGRASP